jgi:hypothetical protein
VIPAAVALGAVGLSAFIIGGPAGLLQVGLYALATVPGWPIGVAGFGRRHAMGWIAGALIGYALTCLALNAALHAHVHTAVGMAVAWLLLNGLTWPLLWLRPTPVVELPAWTSKDTRALLTVLALVPLLMVPVFRNVGVTDADGLRLYRAYFTADFVWHEALANELGRLRLPPINPFAAPAPLHYYWSYFTVPSLVAAFVRPNEMFGPEPFLLANAFCAGLGFIAVLYLAVWTAVPRRWAAAAAVAVALLASSAEGAWTLWSLWRTDGPLAAVREMNIDAMTLWRLRGLTIDGLQRSLWYVPQHAGACALGLIALVVATVPRHAVNLWTAGLAGLALALAVTFSPFPGGLLAVVYGIGVVLVCFGRPRDMARPILVQALAVALAALGVAWVVGSGMVEGAGGAVRLGLMGFARHDPLATILFALGPLLLPGLVGIGLAWRNARLRPAVAGVLLGLPVFFLVSVEGDDVWAGWRAGQIMLVSLPALAAATFGWLHDRAGRWAAGLVCAVLLVVGLPTTVIDAYNAQDVSNRLMGPGFRWTVTLDADQRAAFAWLRKATAADAIVQADPVVRGRDTWTLIQSFAGRRAAAGLPISLLANPMYDALAERVHAIFLGDNPVVAWQTANELRIDYLYVDSADRDGLPTGSLERLARTPEFFPVAFQQGEVTIYAVSHR